MNVSEWETRLDPIHEAIYEDLEETANCGPFDGGCVVVAKALQSVIGGSVVVLTDAADGIALHAAVLMKGNLWDYDGPLPPLEFISRFEQNELQYTWFSCSGYRLFSEGDLVDASRDVALRERLAALFRGVLPEFSHHVPPSP